MYERQLMGENRHEQSINSVTKKWAFLAAICTSPLFILFNYLGDPGRGQAAWVSAGGIAIAARFLWDLKNRVWYWITLVIIVLLHVPMILLISWPFKQLSYIALLPAGLLDFAIVYGIIRLVERAMKPDAASSLQ
jgi:hypothetical protein